MGAALGELLQREGREVEQRPPQQVVGAAAAATAARYLRRHRESGQVGGGGLPLGRCGVALAQLQPGYVRTGMTYEVCADSCGVWAGAWCYCTYSNC